MKRISGGIVLAAFLTLTIVAAAQESDPCEERLNFENIEIGLVIDEMASRTGRKFLVDPRVAGNVTIKSGAESGLCRDEAWELFLAALRVNGFTATPVTSDTFKIVPVQIGAREAGPVNEDNGSGFVTQIIRLDHVNAQEAASSITQMIGETGLVSSISSTNSVIVVDTPDNIERVRKIVSRIDRDSSIVETFTLVNTSASEAAAAVNALARQAAEEGAAVGAARVQTTPIPSSNRLLVRARPEMMARVREIVAEFDAVGGAGASLSVIQLAHADAETMVRLLGDFAEASASVAAAAQSEPVPEDRRPRLSAYPPTNSIIVYGDAEVQRTMKSVITQLDVRRQQVLVEAIIVEVSDATAKQLGVNYFAADRTGERVLFSSNTFGDAERQLLSDAGRGLLESDPDDQEDLAQGALDSLLGLSGFSFGGAATFGSGKIFGAILTAIKEDDQSRVLSFPSVVTLDNEPATLSVGQEIPITTGEAVGNDFTNTFRTVSREEVGVILKVTPHINRGGTVTLKIDQESSNVAGQIIDTSTDLITNKRAITTTSVVDDGDILVIGGLVDQSEERSASKTPILGDAPIVGNLFRSSRRARSNRNLMVFIRPTIIGSREAARVATDQRINFISAQIEASSKGRPLDLKVRIAEVTGVIEAPPLRESPEPSPSAPLSLPDRDSAVAPTPEQSSEAIMPTDAAVLKAPSGSEVLGASPIETTEELLTLESVFYGLHLGSYRTIESAADGWALLRGDFADELGALRARAAQYIDPERGAYERLIVGPFQSRTDAQSTCEKIKEAGGYCAVMPFSGKALDDPV
ncbi:MAG: type II secretion system secretin GspD [Parvularculaceae bacterium]|nr:type II secretion system secretin GspD [Parvularculaceae bacterium]